MNSRFTALMARLKTQRMLSTLVIMLTLTVGILIGTVLSRNGVKGNMATPDAALLPMQSPQQLSNTFGQVTKQVGSAVVNINTESTAKPRRRLRRGQGQGRTIMVAVTIMTIFRTSSTASSVVEVRVDKVAREVRAAMTNRVPSADLKAPMADVHALSARA